MIPGELRVVDDVPGAFAALAAEAIDSAARRPFRLGCSGGGSGKACFARLAEAQLAWGGIECYFVDERCVEEGTAERNDVTIKEALGARREELAGFFPMHCEEGPDVYAARLAAIGGGYDLCQLGVGPDGHTASLFPGADHSDDDSTLVIFNSDPSGNNPFRRMTLTLAAIANSALVVVAAMGEDKADALFRVASGEPLPVAKVRARRIVFLADRAAASRLEGVS